MLRRFPFQKHEQGSLALFRQASVRIKDRITLFDFEKNKQLLQELKRVIDAVSYDKGETLKIVVGSSAIKLFMDEGSKDIISDLTKRFTLRNSYTNISEISMLFPEEAIETKGIISFISRELYLNDVLILEMLTATPELLIYVKGNAVLKAYQVIKRLAGAEV